MKDAHPELTKALLAAALVFAALYAVVSATGHSILN